MKIVISSIAVFTVLMLASMFGTVNAAEVHKNGFGGITPLNTTGLTVFNESQKRSFDYESDSLVLSAEFSILETNGDIRDFSLFDNDLTRYNVSPSIEPGFVDSTFRTALETTSLLLNVNLSSTGDSFVDETNPDDNYGSDGIMNVQSLSGDNHRSFVQWDLSSIPSTSYIQEATMWLLKDSDTASGFPRTYNARTATSSWVEGTINWTNQPAVSGSGPSQTITIADVWYSWDMTSIVQDWIDGTLTNNGLRISDNVEGEATASYFVTREGADPPMLDITYRGGQWAEASYSESLDMENTNVSLIWWGQIKETGLQYITGNTCTASGSFNYGLYIDSNSEIVGVTGSSFPTCSFDPVPSGLPVGGLSPNQTYGIGIVFEDTPSGADIHFWLDGEWIYNEINSRRVGNSPSKPYYVGRAGSPSPETFCNCTHDEVLVFKERLSNDTMKLLTTKQHDIVIRSGPRTTTPGFEGLFFALPWLIAFGLIGWLFYVIFRVLKEPFTRD